METKMSNKSRKLSKNENTSSKSKSKQVVSRVVIEGEGRDEWDKRYLKFSVVGSDRDIPPFSIEQFFGDSKPVFAALANAGWNGFTTKARNELLEKLQKRKPEPPSFKVVTRLGWNSGAYVFPDEIVGKPKTPLQKAFGRLDHAMLDKYRVNGTLEQWQDQIASKCVGNSRLMFAVSLAFTGPILRFVTGPKSGGFQPWGPAETGKTTGAMVAGSVWGCHRGEGRREKGFAESWNSTAGKIEVTALAHNDSLLILDETKRAGKDDRERAQVVTSVAFGLAEFTEKERLTNPDSVRSWRCYFLSTSNLSLGQLGNRGHVVIDEAERGRLADIPLPNDGHGIYEELHGFVDGEALSDALQHRSRKYYGVPARKFVRKLVSERETDPQGLKKFLKAERSHYLKKLKAEVEADGLRPLNRNSGRYATVFAAGSLAIKFGILAWSRKKLLKAILSCQLDQLRRADDDDEGADPSVESLRAKLVRYLDDHRSKFMYLNKKRPQLGSHKLGSVAGYRAKIKGDKWYYLTADQLTAIIGKGPNAGTLKHTLVNEGLMDHAKKKFVVQRKIFVGGKGNKNYAWVHAIKADIRKKKDSGTAEPMVHDGKE
jgi:putative DNA primase/helicase